MANSKRRAADQTRAILAVRFPKCFSPQGTSQPKKALKLGIHREIAAACPDLTPSQISDALFDYTRGLKYAQALTAGAPRIDLSGEPDGIVTADYADIVAAKALARGIIHTGIQRLENENRDLKLFCVDVRGSGERIACPSYESARDLSDKINLSDQAMRAVPAPWDGSYDDHQLAMHGGDPSYEAVKAAA